MAQTETRKHRVRQISFRLVYGALGIAVVGAAAVLAYFTLRTGARFAELGAETIVQSTLLIVDEKVEQVEQRLIQSDNAVFEALDLDAPENFAASFLASAATVAPTVECALVLDENGSVISYGHTGSRDARREFLSLLERRVLPDLELEQRHTGRLKHLHQTYGRRSYLLSSKALRHQGRKYYVVLSHDTARIADTVFDSLFATEAGKRQYNVVDDDNARIYGPNLARAGDYLVGRRFPTTLYGWRLQVAPKQAPLLDAEARSRRKAELALVLVALVILFLGTAAILFAAEKQRRLNSLKAEFVANVSHELKTPLSVIRMFGEMLSSGRVKNAEKQRQYLEIISRESDRLSALIENVLDFAALERGRRTYDLRPTVLTALVDRTVDTFRYRLEHDGTEVLVDLPEDKVLADLDEQAVMLALINLLDNAAKYGGGDRIQVEVTADRQRVVVAVRDHGPGIPPEQHKRVFERFYRIHNDNRTRGSGIGLSIVRYIAQAHGGDAWVENAQGGGARVCMWFPRLEDEHSQAPTRPSSAA